MENTLPNPDQGSLLEQLKQSVYGGKPVDLPNPEPVNIPLNQSIRGDFSTGPNPGFKDPNQKMGKQILDYMAQADTWAYDNNRFAKTYDFGSDWKHANFERYYSHPSYDKLKFSPYRDNDLHYNNNSSAFDDFLRSANGNLRLFGHGYISSEESSDSAGEAMERVNSIYGSTRGGLGGFVPNLYLSAGYTQGLVTRVIMEELALAYLTGQSGGSAAPVTAPRFFENIYSLGKGLYNVGKNLGKTLTTFKNLDNIDLGRKIWQAARSSPKSVANLIAPRTTEYFTNLSKGIDAGQEFYDLSNYAKTFKGFGSMYMDYREFALATSEGGMEGKMLQSKLNEDLIDEYYQKNGFMPEGKDAEDIYNRSVTAGKMNSLWNSVLIYGSNKIVFNRLFKGVPSFTTAARKVIESPIGELKRLPLKLGQNFYELAKGGIGSGISKALFSSSYSPLSRKYMLANITEGLQEASQDALATGFEEYYKNVNTNPAHANYAEMLDALGRGFGKQFNKQGFETFASGYLMSTLVQPAIGIVSEFAPIQGRRVLPKALRDRWGIQSYDEVIKDREDRRNTILESLNQVVKDPYKMNTTGVDYMAEVLEHQKKIVEAEKTGDRVAIEDARKELYFDHLYRVITTGHIDQVKDYFKSIDKLTDQELAEAFDKPIGEVGNIRKELKKSSDNVEVFTKIYNKQNERFPDFFDERKYKKDSVEYKAALRGARAFREAKKHAMFANFAFLDATERMKGYVDDFTNNPPLSKGNVNDLVNVFDIGAMQNKMEALDNENRLLQGDPNNKTKIDQNNQLKASMKRFVDSIALVNTIQAAVKEEAKTPGAIQTIADESQITKNSVVLNNKGKEFIVADVVGRQVILKDKAGKRYKPRQKRGLKLVKPGEEARILFDKENPLGYGYATMYDAFKDYLQKTANVTGEQLFDENVDNAFMKVKDYYRLDNESRSMGAVSNILHNPDNLFQLAVRLERSLEAIDEKKKEYHREAVKQDERAKDYNALINVLYDRGYKLTPQGVDDIINNVVPKEFFDEPSGRVINKDNDKVGYEKAKGVVEWYFNLREKEKQNEAAQRKKEEEEVAKASKKHYIEETPEGKFAVMSPEGKIVGAPFDKKEDALQILDSLNKAFEEESKKKGTEQTPPPPPPPPAGQEKVILKAITVDTPYETMPDDLKKELIRGARIANASEGYRYIDENASTEEIEGDEWFLNEYLKKYKHAKSVIEKFNNKLGLKVEKQEEPPAPGQTPPEVIARLELVSKFGMDQAVVDKMTTDEVLAEYDKRSKAPVSTDAKADIEAKKADIERIKKEKLDNLYKEELEKEDRIALDKIYNTGKIGDTVTIGVYTFTKTGEDEWSSFDDAGTFSYSTEKMGNIYFDIEYGKTKEAVSLAFFASYINQNKALTPQEEIKDLPLVKKILEIEEAAKKELTALEGKEEKGDFITDYFTQKRTMPNAEGLTPMVIYATPTTGKTRMSLKYGNVIDGDFIIYKYLVEKGIKPIAETQQGFDKGIEDSGLTLWMYADSLSPEKRLATYKEVADIMKQYKDQGYTVVTGNFFMREYADKAYLSKDVDSIANVFMLRNVISKADAMDDANKVVTEDEAAFKKRGYINIPIGKTFEDVFFPSEKDMQEEFLARITNASEKELNDIELEISKLGPKDLSEIDIDELNTEINNRRIILSKTVTFDDVALDDYLMLSDNRIVRVDNKVLGKFITVSVVNDPTSGTLSISEEEFPNMVFGKYIKGMIPAKTPTESIEGEQEYKNNIANNGKAITKDEDIDSINKAKPKKGRKFGNDTDPNDCGG